VVRTYFFVRFRSSKEKNLEISLQKRFCVSPVFAFF